MSTPPNSSAKYTAKYNDFEREVVERLTRIETQLQSSENHEQRISMIEAELNKNKGFIAALSVCIGVVSALLSAGIVKFLL